MNAFLRILDAERKPDEHFVRVMDQAGWHKSKGLKLTREVIKSVCRCHYLERAEQS